jgi:hypothetical protein
MMNMEFDKMLCERYPTIMQDRHRNPQETTMCWGFECGDGWFDLLDTAMQAIQRHEQHLAHHNVEFEPVVFEQVKEKFGTLRIYYRGGDEYVSGVIDFAENLSGRVCEDCGAPGRPTGRGWIRTLCEQHQPEVIP